MVQEKIGVAGSLESCDALVMVVLSPGREGIEIELDSPSIASFGEEMRKAVRETLESVGIVHGFVKVQDRGSLDCTLRARTEAAARRALAVPAGERVEE
ncbi:citrate lyase acyl carrier protein [Aminivibrio sp.]|jgi:citrate lyase subunit gamma (acyl carrier protein)|uniref:citrate lyase acyl carrier protein n=1 Tax=Aminivibrio sp. TaxID=1872489 RepID=UPI001A4B38AE|nr:citrate lyase acyl carrier protein [Aminivibrio sp.]MBL3539734.1 citrate lyase acyl carrier protein [Aminivibrio sp.]MDK2958783.1 hypothetical protein [Synergistaceae bacterium]